MAIRVIGDRRSKGSDPAADWADAVGQFSAEQTASALVKAAGMPGSVADPNMVQVVWPVLVMPLTAAALDFGNVTEVKVKLGQLIASQTWIQRDRLVKHIQAGGAPLDNGSPFVTLPLLADANIIVDGHHRLTALWLLAGSDMTIPAWQIPIGIATGHPR